MITTAAVRMHRPHPTDAIATEAIVTAVRQARRGPLTIRIYER
jgi:hypothetical protein